MIINYILSQYVDSIKDVGVLKQLLTNDLTNPKWAKAHFKGYFSCIYSKTCSTSGLSKFLSFINGFN